MKELFFSHASEDKELVERIRRLLKDQGVNAWTDVRHLVPGDGLPGELKEAIENRPALLVLLTVNGLNSDWVQNEVQYALEQNKRIIPLLGPDLKIPAVRSWFPEEPIYIPLDPQHPETGLPGILNALGLRAPRSEGGLQEPDRPETMEELILTLKYPALSQEDGKQQVTAVGSVVWRSAIEGERKIEGDDFTFTAPLGPIELDELKWYLEDYYIWPVGVFRERARKVEDALPQWGRELFSQALPQPHCKQHLAAWDNSKERGERRFTVVVHDQPLPGADDAAQKNAGEAATRLLALPWELLHDKTGYMFQGARPTRVRRRLPNTTAQGVAAVDPPIRILLVSPRPEQKGTGYIDHRISAEPLVRAMEDLGGLVELTVLVPPTFPALEKALQDAWDAETPYHVVHFDGHGVYDRIKGLGGLCFEDPQDDDKLQERRSKVIGADQLAPVIQKHRIPLFFLEACQSAVAEVDTGSSVAAALLNQGVACVAAMSHSVLVETARRFVTEFYQALAEGKRVGRAMLEGQKALKSDNRRIEIFGAGQLCLDDWFVPVLFQEETDPILFRKLPSKGMKALTQKARTARKGSLPDPPPHGFLGRSRKLLALERLLATASHAVVVGQGGEGKTTLAVELATWLLRTGRFDRAAFVSMERCLDTRTALNALGVQLVPSYALAQYQNLEEALAPLERALAEDRVLIVLDNMETVLKPEGGTDADVFEPETLKGLLAFYSRLRDMGGTLLFTTRQPLPEPFTGGQVPLGRLEKKDAVKLVRQVLDQAGQAPGDEAGNEDIEALVEAMGCHARGLVLAANSIPHMGVKAVTRDLAGLMQQLHAQHPESRERSLFASVELSLRRLPPDVRQHVNALAVFHGGFNVAVLAMMEALDQEQLAKVIAALVKAGLAELMDYGYLRLHPALAPYLVGTMTAEVRETYLSRWVPAMVAMTQYLKGHLSQDIQQAFKLTLLDLPNLLALLETVRAAGDPETTVALAGQLEQLVRPLARPRALARITEIHQALADQVKGWSLNVFNAAKNQVERQLAAGNLSGALKGAQALLERALKGGEDAYEGAAYNLGFAYKVLGKALSMGGAASEALGFLAEAQQRFEVLAEKGNDDAAGMAARSMAEIGNCLTALGRLDEAVVVYEEKIKRSEALNDTRSIATGKFQLGTTRMLQKEYKQALTAYEEAKTIFEGLDEQVSVASIWHQIGMVFQESKQFESADGAYRQSLAIATHLKDRSGEASTLGQLGILYKNNNRLEEAVVFFQQAADRYIQLDLLDKEGIVMNNMADALIKLGRNNQARKALLRAIECGKPFGHVSQPWKTYDILCDLEKAEGREAKAQAAREQAIEMYLAYRRDGGENHNPGGRLCQAFTQALDQDQVDAFQPALTEILENEEMPEWYQTLAQALYHILNGSRDPELANNPKLYYGDVAELKIILSKLQEG